MCVRCGTGRVAWCTAPDRHGDIDLNAPGRFYVLRNGRACANAVRQQADALAELEARTHPRSVVQVVSAATGELVATWAGGELLPALPRAAREDDELCEACGGKVRSGRCRDCGHPAPGLAALDARTFPHDEPCPRCGRRQWGLGKDTVDPQNPTDAEQETCGECGFRLTASEDGYAGQLRRRISQAQGELDAHLDALGAHDERRAGGGRRHP
jgi:hypothetical protein